MWTFKTVIRDDAVDLRPGGKKEQPSGGFGDIKIGGDFKIGGART